MRNPYPGERWTALTNRPPIISAGPRPTSVVVSIGRNIRSTPMSRAEWLSFQREVESCLVGALSLKVSPTPNLGIGEWDSVAEDSAIYSVWDIGGFNDGQLTILRRSLSLLTDLYSQDAIALTVGQSELITS